MGDTLTFFKCTRANGTDFRSGTKNYSVIGSIVEESGADVSHNASCGRGLHVSPTAMLTCQFGDRSIDRGKWRWFEVRADVADVIGSDNTKSRVKKLEIVREISREEIFGKGFSLRIEQVRDEFATWKAIAWLKPVVAINHELVAQLFADWHERITPFKRSGWWGDGAFPKIFRIVTDRKQAERLATATATAAAAADAADAAATAAAAADAAAAAADADADAAATAAADAADTAAAAADAADAADAAAARVFNCHRHYWWYTRPCWVLLRWARWHMSYETPNPWEPLVEMYKLGCAPLGYVKHDDGIVAFTVYAPLVRP